MAYAFPEGAKFYFSQTFAAAKTLSAMTNADPTVATSVAHGYSDADPLLLESGWEDATESVFEADSLTADTFSLLGLETSDTTFYAAGAGAASTTKKISGWTEIPQILTISSSGGDPRFNTINPLSRRNGINVPVGFNPTTITLTLGHDASNANFKTMLSISRRLAKVAFKLVLSGGSRTYGYGYMATSEMPGLNQGQANSVPAVLSLLGRAISYE